MAKKKSFCNIAASSLTGEEVLLDSRTPSPKLILPKDGSVHFQVEYNVQISRFSTEMNSNASKALSTNADFSSCWDAPKDQDKNNFTC